MSHGRFLLRVEAAAKQPDRFWRAHRTLFRSSAPSSAAARRLPDTVLDAQLALVSEPQQRRRSWAAAFESVCCAAPPTARHAISFAREVDASLLVPFEQLPSEHRGAELHSLGRVVTLVEVKSAIQRMRRAVASGPDSIPAFFFKDGGERVVVAVTALLNDVLTHGVWPSDWLLGWISPIFKKGSRVQPLDYRGITLLPIVDKLCRSVLNSRLSSAIEERRLLSDFQAGFRARHSTVDHLLTLNEIATAHRERERPLYMAFLDVRKAYDHTWRNGLWHRMRKIGVPDRVLRVWRSSYRQVRRAVLVNEEITDEFECEAGLAQGAVDSPTLYDVFVDELAALLLARGFGVTEGVGERIPLLMYADDIVLLASSPEQLQRMLTLVQWFAERWQFEYNISKSAVVMSGHATPAMRAAARAWTWVLAGMRLPVPDYYLYLGVEFGLVGAGRWLPVIRRKLAACRARSQRLLWANGNRYGISPALQSRLWAGTCRPQLEYGCALWSPQITKHQAQLLEEVQHGFACSTLGVVHSTSRAFVRAELGLLPLSARRDELTLRTFGVIMCMTSARLVHRVVRRRLEQARAGGAKRSWCSRILRLFTRYGLDEHWRSGVVTDEAAWSTLCAENVQRVTNEEWRTTVRTELSSLALYSQLKVEPCAEEYLSNSGNREGRLLKLLTRAGTLPLMPFLASVLHLGVASRVRCCPLCVAAARASGAAEGSALVCDAPVESIQHFMLQCPALNELRVNLFDRLHSALMPTAELVSRWLVSATHADRLLFILGGTMSEYDPVRGTLDARASALYRQMMLPTTTRAVDRAVQNFLLLAWRRRESLLGGSWTCAWRPASGHAEVRVAARSNDPPDAPPRPPLPPAPLDAFDAASVHAHGLPHALDAPDSPSVFSLQVAPRGAEHGSDSDPDSEGQGERAVEAVRVPVIGSYALEFRARPIGRSAEMLRRAGGDLRA
jgi:hypothetical protein